MRLAKSWSGNVAPACNDPWDVPLTITYELRDDGPPAMPWPVYERRLREEWQQLLEAGPSEPEVQEFMETHPALVPGAHAAVGRMASGHGPFPSALIARPRLKGRRDRVPDFLWLASDSAFFNPVFIEIETPTKPWLTEEGLQHHKLTQALQQVDEWEEWFNEPYHRQLFYEQYQVPLVLRRRRWDPIWLLIYGRQSDDRERIAQLRARLRRPNRLVIPYEHVEPDEEASEYICIRNVGGEYEAVSIPPTMHVGPNLADDWARVQGKEAALLQSAWMTRERKAFLRDRFRYWDEWVRTREHQGLVGLGDRE